jgi:hypothetical protein
MTRSNPHSLQGKIIMSVCFRKPQSQWRNLYFHYSSVTLTLMFSSGLQEFQDMYIHVLMARNGCIQESFKVVCVCVCVCVWWKWFWTQGFASAEQVLYCLSHTSSPFCSSYFGVGNYLPRLALNWSQPRIIGVSHWHLASKFLSKLLFPSSIFCYIKQNQAKLN